MQHRAGFYEKYVKRLLHIVLSGLALIVLSPVLLVTAILVLVKLWWPPTVGGGAGAAGARAAAAPCCGSSRPDGMGTGSWTEPAELGR